MLDFILLTQPYLSQESPRSLVLTTSVGFSIPHQVIVQMSQIIAIQNYSKRFSEALYLGIT